MRTFAKSTMIAVLLLLVGSVAVPAKAEAQGPPPRHHHHHIFHHHRHHHR